MSEASRYIPALRFRRLTRFYDSVLSATLKEERFKGLLVSQAAPRPGQRVLDVGCGTATLTIMLKRACPDVEAVGLDGDPDALTIARRKIEAERAAIELHEGMSFDLPFGDGSFDRVVSSLVFHHLTRESKKRTFAEIRRVLKKGGELHVADWGRAQNAFMRAAFLGVQLFDGFATTADNVEGRLPSMMVEAGFENVAETHREMTLFGTLSLYRGRRP